MKVAIVALITCSVNALNLDTKFMESAAPQAHKIDPEIEWADNFGWDVPKARNIPGWSQTANKRRTQITALQNQSIIFYGDSMVESWVGETLGHKNPERTDMPSIWKANFVDRYGPSHASGIGGDTVSNLLWRLQNGESPEKAQPRVIMLHIGTNDLQKNWYKLHNDVAPARAAAAIFSGYKKVVEELDRASPHSVLLLTNIMPRSSSWGTSKSTYKTIIPELNRLIASLADDSTIYFSDCSHVILGKSGKVDTSLSEDYLHFTKKGAEGWAGCLQPTLDKILKPDVSKLAEAPAPKPQKFKVYGTPTDFSSFAIDDSLDEE